MKVYADNDGRILMSFETFCAVNDCKDALFNANINGLTVNEACELLDLLETVHDGLTADMQQNDK